MDEGTFEKAIADAKARADGAEKEAREKRELAHEDEAEFRGRFNAFQTRITHLVCEEFGKLAESLGPRSMVDEVRGSLRFQTHEILTIHASPGENGMGKVTLSAELPSGSDHRTYETKQFPIDRSGDEAVLGWARKTIAGWAERLFNACK